MSIAAQPFNRPISFVSGLVRAILDGRKIQTRRLVRTQPDCIGKSESNQPVAFTNGERIDCPLGQSGDLLWVREKWAYRRDVQSLFSCGDSEIVYAADVQENFAGSGWRPSRFMPRKLSRIQLKIESLRIERVSQISMDDAIAEGFDGSGADPRKWFEALWDLLCDESSCFKANPFVWVIGFSVVSRSNPQTL